MDRLTQVRSSKREQRYRRFFQIVDEVAEEIQAHRWAETGTTKRRVRGEQLQKLRASVETLIRDSVAVVYQRKRKGDAPIHLNTNWYSSSVGPVELTYNIHVKRAYLGMVELGYLEETQPGYYDRSGQKGGQKKNRLTRYGATNRLIDKFTKEEQEVFPVIVPPAMDHASIRVRIKQDDDSEEVLLAPNTVEVREMAVKLARINAVLASRWYDLHIPDTELADLQAQLANDEKDPKPLALHRRILHRVFNDRDLKTGGRFYGGWWQNVPKAYRRHLIVNGKRMVEMDYSNLHPAILYAQEGIAPPEDCYRGIFDCEVEARHGDELRSMVKAAFNAMLNAENTLRQVPRDIEPKRFGMTWKDVSTAIMSAHQPIAHHFYTGAGKRLQRIDSDVAERTMLDFIDHGIAILPIHDSFLVHDGHGGRLEDTMQKALREVCGVKTKLKLVQPDLSRVLAKLEEERRMDPDGFGPETSQDICEILASRDGYDKRLDAFYAMANAKDT
ncbi:hypothetical protein [Phaeobacter gallaeciensis]|uniref:hypothetical protein n=1 Tax=Phaeobacter gallaeciensis TaxID=60890 RepID=UPI000BBF9323|nr:hypothetical protein [Phaeobacter gallaeciensis]ATF16810.1 hypothetical protein PhaeoP129_00140 [Phaeobacter gallaeciensis]ATF20919.1 hypothetical protein PhaeoP128_00140 [Phaeobacter gallaeciensis]